MKNKIFAIAPKEEASAIGPHAKCFKVVTLFLFLALHKIPHLKEAKGSYKCPYCTIPVDFWWSLCPFEILTQHESPSPVNDCAS